MGDEKKDPPPLTHTEAHTHTQREAHTQRRARTRTHSHAHTHTHTHTHAHAHTHCRAEERASRAVKAKDGYKQQVCMHAWSDLVYYYYYYYYLPTRNDTTLHPAHYRPCQPGAHQTPTVCTLSHHTTPTPRHVKPALGAPPPRW